MNISKRFKRRQQWRWIEDELGPALNERVWTRNFRTRQKFGPASPVRRIEITDEIRAAYDAAGKSNQSSKLNPVFADS